VLAIIEGFCGKGGRAARVQMVEALSMHALSAGLLWFNCREDQGMPRYRLRAQVFLVEATAATELGVDATSSVQAALPSLGQSHARLLAKLKALEQQRKAEMIGEPVLRLRPNQPAETASGGEFQVVDRSARRGEDGDSVDRTSWKQHGLLLKINATPLNDARVRLAFDMTFKSRTQGESQALTLHSMKSEVDLVLGVATMAGSLDLQTSASDLERLPLLSAVPLIGPLFQSNARQHSKSRLFLWLELSEDDGRADIPKAPPLGPAPEL
jgi:type II secretory pathway component HofQ